MAISYDLRDRKRIAILGVADYYRLTGSYPASTAGLVLWSRLGARFSWGIGIAPGGWRAILRLFIRTQANAISLYTRLGCATSLERSLMKIMFFILQKWL